MTFHARWDVALLSCTDELPHRLRPYLYWAQTQGLHGLDQDLAAEMNARAGFRARGRQLLQFILEQFLADAPIGADVGHEDMMRMRTDGGNIMTCHARWDAARLSCTDELLQFILEQFRTDASTGAHFSDEDLMRIRTEGGKIMAVHARWDVVLLSCTDELPHRLRRYLDWAQILGLHVLDQDLAEYRTYYEGDPHKSYETLWRVADRYCFRTRQDRNRAEQTRALARGSSAALAATSKAPAGGGKEAARGARGNAANGQTGTGAATSWNPMHGGTLHCSAAPMSCLIA